MAVVLALVGIAAVGCSQDNPADTAPTSTPTSASAISTTTTAPPTTTSELPTNTVEAPVVETTYEAPTEPTYEETTAPTVQTVALGDYCSARGTSAITSDGSTAYCSRLAGTDAYIWSLTSGVAPNPGLQQHQVESSALSPGDTCYDSNATATDAQGRTIYCNPTVNGRYAGNLVWQLAP